MLKYFGRGLIHQAKTFIPFHREAGLIPNHQSLITILVGVVLWSGATMSLYAQPDTLWTRTFGGTDDDEGHSVQQTSDGGFIIAGWTRSFGAGSGDVYLIRTDSSGDTLWTKTYGGTNGDRGHSVQQTSDSGFIIAGLTNSFGAGNGDVYLIRTNASGDTLWTKTYGGIDFDWSYSVQECASGGFIIAGGTGSFGAGSSDVYLIRTNASGDTIWTKTYGGTDSDEGESVQETQDSGFIIAGRTYSFGAGGLDVYLIRTNASGDTLWTKTYGGTNYDGGYSVQQTSDGGFIIAGYTYSFGAGSKDVYLIRTNASGDTLWTRTYGGIDYDWGCSVQETSDGGFIIAGRTYSFGVGVSDVYLIRTNASGTPLWTKTYGGIDYDWGCSVQQTSDGGFIIAGCTRAFGAGGFDVYLIRTSAVGVEDRDSSPKAKNGRLETYPNPFIGATEVEYNLHITADVDITIYNLLGQKVATLVNENKKAGYYTAIWDGKDNNGKEVASGVYFCRFSSRILRDFRCAPTGEYIATKKMYLIR